MLNNAFIIYHNHNVFFSSCQFLTEESYEYNSLLKNLYYNDKNLSLTANKILEACHKENTNLKIKKNLCEKNLIKINSSKEASNFLKEKFSFIPEANNKGIMTGYYEPELRAYKSKGITRYPIYNNPKIIGKKKTDGII